MSGSVQNLFLERADTTLRLECALAEITRQQERIKHYEDEVTHLHELLRSLKREAFGKKSERWESVEQGSLFNEVERLASLRVTDEEQDEGDAAPDEIEVAAHKKKRGHRKALPAELPREVVVVELPEAERVDDEGVPLKVIGHEVSEKLVFEPATMKVIEYHRCRYGRDFGDGVKTAPPVASIIPKGMATSSLLAHITLQKYAYGLPLYRQEEIFQSLGVELPRCTMARWIVQAAEKCRPIWNILEERLMARDYVSCDETHTQVLKEKGRTAESKSWMWLRATPRGESRILLFDYDRHRSGAVAKRLFEGYEGTLQVDGYASYDGLVSSPNSKITRIGCNMHARRRFESALVDGAPKGRAQAEVAMQFYQAIYKVEEKARALSAPERHQMRQELAVPIWAEFKQWSLEQRPKVPPKSKLGEALRYFENEYEFLVGYLRHGQLEADNGFAERAIKYFAIGRKNWLFSDTAEGAEASALFYSFAVTAKLNGVDPYTALKEIFEGVPVAQTINDFEKLADILTTRPASV